MSAPRDELDEIEAGFRQVYMARRMSEFYVALADANAVVMVVLQILCVSILDPLAAHPLNRVHLLWVRIALLCALALYPLMRKLPQPIGPAFIMVVDLSLAAASAMLLGRLGEAGVELAQVVPGAAHLMALALMMTMAAPAGQLGSAVFALAMSLIVVALAVAMPVFAQFAVAVCATIALMHWVHLSDLAAVRKRLLAELTLRLKVAPHDLVRRSAFAESYELADALALRRRRCMCLASDWREFQPTTRQATPERMASALGAYYDVCRSLLRTHFASGGFYSDWIADELFVTFIIDSENPDAQLAAKVLAYARDLVAARAAFAAAHGMPRGIDVGIAWGDAIVGLAGPSRNRKLMAFGGAAMRARALQARGKQLRATLGARDRIVYDAATARAALAGLAAGAHPAAHRLPDGACFEEPADRAETVAAVPAPAVA